MTDQASWKPEAIETLRLLSYAIDGMAEALEEDDGILGSLAGMGVANHLAALPKHIRDVFSEQLTDEAAAGLRADRAYLAEVESCG